MPVTVISSAFSITSTVPQQFFYVTGAYVITLPSAPVTGQILSFSIDNTGASLNPNGKVFRQANADWPTSLFSEFGTTTGGGLTLIYNGTKWNVLSVN
jgi:hypothetical protein